MIEELVDRIWSYSEFQAEYQHILIASMQTTIFRGIKGARLSPSGGVLLEPSDEVISRLLQVASHFSASTQVHYREAAYRICVSIWELMKNRTDDSSNLKELIHYIFSRLGNFPAGNFLYHEAPNDDRIANLPLHAWMSLDAHEKTNTIAVADGVERTLTDFQVALWGSLEAGRSVAVSAPTSAGKSYALGHYLVKKLNSDDHKFAAYIVPTRALLNQVSIDLSSILSGLPIKKIPISTVPVSPTELNITGGIYVLTQERMQVLLDADPKLDFDFVVIDEAQGISEESRGVILETVIQEILRRHERTQLLFAAPTASNPAVFGDMFRIPIDLIPRPERPTAQNLVLLKRVPIPKRKRVKTNDVDIDVSINKNNNAVGSMTLPLKLGTDDQTLAAMSYFVGGNDKNLVYASAKARCEKVAKLISEYINSDSSERINIAEPQLGLFDTSIATEERRGIDDDLKSDLQKLSSFISDHVHKDFPLVETVRHGVAFHYGNMPSLVRKSIETYFLQGKISHLVCTSTLLHGVNLPAKNLFLLKPTKGSGREANGEITISSQEFWNLAGRAGRLGKEFEGNVFLIDYASWSRDLLAGESEQEIQSAVGQTLASRREEFFEYVQNRNHASGIDPANESVLVKLVNSARAGRLQTELEHLLPEDASVRVEVDRRIQEVVSTISVPSFITEKNITVSVLRQQEMMDHLMTGIKANGPLRYLPAHPLGEWNNVSSSLIAIFKRIHTHFEKKNSKDGSHTYFGQLAARWMRGLPLPVIIQNAITYRLSRKPNTKIPTIIRDTLNDIENNIRFRYVKYVNCYQDILAYALNETNNSELIEQIPTTALYLELGASSTTMINLVGLGLSRTTASLLAPMATGPNLNRDRARSWLASQPLAELNLSQICINEIEEVLLATEA